MGTREMHQHVQVDRRRITDPCLHMLLPEAQEQVCLPNLATYLHPHAHINLEQGWRHGGPLQTKALCRVSLLQLNHGPAGAQMRQELHAWLQPLPWREGVQVRPPCMPSSCLCCRAPPARSPSAATSS